MPGTSELGVSKLALPLQHHQASVLHGRHVEPVFHLCAARLDSSTLPTWEMLQEPTTHAHVMDALNLQWSHADSAAHVSSCSHIT